MRFLTDASDGSPSLHALYEHFIAYANTSHAYVGNTIKALLVIAITAAVLGIIVVAKRRKEQQQYAAIKKEREENGRDIRYVGSSSTSHESDNTLFITGFIAALALIVVNIVGIPWMDSQNDRTAQQTEIAEQIEKTAHRHIREDYIVAEVKAIDKPHDSAGHRAQDTYAEEMHQWAKDFYRANGRPLTVEVQLEDEPSVVYTYRLWYNHHEDRAVLLNHYDTSQLHDTAPEVESLIREDS